MLLAFALAACVGSLLPAALFCVNLRLYRIPPSPGTVPLPAISVLIPARNEETSIAAALDSVLASGAAEFEVIVMDDDSTDCTAAIVEAIAAKDLRIRLALAPPLPAGWNGKQHACFALAKIARHPLLCFMDADVRLAPEALARMAAFLERSDSALVSGFPRQLTGSFLEWLLLPLIHFVLLGFLPLSRMRAGTDPAMAAGCGQFLLVRAEAYAATGGHAEIRATMHDGLLLPRLFRRHGYRTDLADLTPLARVRMYTNARDTWQGLAKNATEGIAAPERIVPITLLLFAGQVLPFILAVWLALHPAAWANRLLVLAAVCAALLPRILAATRFRQDWRSAALHPLGILSLLALQWYALVRKLRGGTVSWRARAYTDHPH
jgi:glycosyltransferase involved in cell wall biosynthesis